LQVARSEEKPNLQPLTQICSCPPRVGGQSHFHLPLANRQSLSFRLGKNIAIPFRPPTEVGGYENKACWSRLTWKSCEFRVACSEKKP